MSARRIRRREVRDAPGGLQDGLPPLLARLYRARGVSAAAEIDFELASLLPPTSMKGIEAAGARLADALAGEEPLLVVGDYDADGATSTALLLLGLRAMGCTQAAFLVPNRFGFGYGLTPGLVRVAAALDPRPGLIVTVDNGMSSIEGVAEARACGIDVLVTDHHLPGEAVPDACVILNPNQHGCAFPSKALAGVGVVFYLLGALRAELRARDWFAARGLAEPRLAEFLDLVALGTVADVVPLDANNRVLVQQGLLRLRAGRGRPGVRALLEVAGRDPRRVVSSDLGFAAGPRLNAAGRLDDMSLGIRCLLEDDPAEARRMAGQLDRLNRERRGIEAGMQQEALALLGDALGGGDPAWGVCLYHPGWHQGVVGLVASRVKDRLHRPVIAFAPAGEGGLKGSARSIRGLHVRDALAAVDASFPGLIERFGGHAAAAGLSLAEDRLAEFALAFDAAVRRLLDPASLEDAVETDGELAAQELTLETAELLRAAAPWGQQFPEPLFDGEFRLLSQRLVGERHLRLALEPRAAPGTALPGIAFGVDTDRWPDPSVQRARLVYRLAVDEYRGERLLQLQVEQIEALA